MQLANSYALIAAVVAALVLWRLLASKIERELARALRSKDTSALIAELQKKPRALRPAAFNHAIRRLWDAYERPLAVSLIRVLAEEHNSEQIAQYWLDQLHSVEPKLATEHLGQGFYDNYFSPKVAATCGKAG